MPYQTLPNLSQSNKIRLAKLILMYFREANFAKGMNEEDIFAEFSPEDIRLMRLSLSNTGLIAKANFASASGTAYVTTEQGLYLLESEDYG